MNLQLRHAFVLIGVTIFPLVSTVPSALAAGRPNIILIMGDDMGFSDLGCYGGEIQTPNLDKLAAHGVRFTQFYNTARCCPTRASLMTGLYPHQAGVGHMMNDRGTDGYRGNLNRRCMTIAEVLKTAGYGTYMAGKWHITRHTAPNGPKFNWPLQRGYDRFYGTIHGAGSFYDPNSLTRDNTQISPYADPEYKPKQYYYTDAISDHAIRFINDHLKTSKEKPFFVYVAYTAAHWPMHALPEDIAKYKGKYDKGYAPIRAARLKKARQLGLIKKSWEMSPQAENWENVKKKEWEARCMEVYAAMVDRMDQGIGKIVETLRKNGQLENTLILFLQDNGGCAEGLGRRGRGKIPHPLRASKPTFPPMKATALQTSMIPRQTRDGWPVLMGNNVMPGPADTYIAYGRGWANVSNTPFREYKHWVHEGGISTPLIAHWPASIKSHGQLRHEPSHLIDIMATCVDVSGAKYPVTFKGEKIQPLEGKSLAPVFSGKSLSQRALFWEHEGNRAVRIGKWKLVAKGRRGPWELYDLDADRTELNNLASQFPERVAEMADMWTSYAKRTNVLPWPNTGRAKKSKAGKKPRRKKQQK
ncbi:MAG: arylsulfatase [Planctomycetaceae bacterium]